MRAGLERASPNGTERRLDYLSVSMVVVSAAVVASWAALLFDIPCADAMSKIRRPAVATMNFARINNLRLDAKC